MEVILVKIWVVLLCIVDVMILVQLAGRAVLCLRGKKGSVNWAVYNRILLVLFAIAFLPFTLGYLYITRS